MTHGLVTVRGLRLAEDPDRWWRLGFVVEDGPTPVTHVGGIRLAYVPEQGRGGIVGWTLDPPPTPPIEGLPSFPDPDVPTDRNDRRHREEGDHPNGIVAVDHVVVAADDMEAAIAAFRRAGLVPRRVADGLRGDDRRYAFFVAGTCVVEVIAPAVARPAARPPRFVGLAFVAPDLDRTARVLGDLAGPVRDAVQPGRWILTVRTDAAGIRVPVAVMSPRP